MHVRTFVCALKNKQDIKLFLCGKLMPANCDSPKFTAGITVPGECCCSGL